MRLILLTAIMSLSSLAFAQDLKPFQLEPGQYRFECISSIVNEMAEGIQRGDYFETGVQTVTQSNDQFVEFLQSQDEFGFSTQSSSISKYEAIPNTEGQFKYTIQSTFTYFDRNDKLMTESSTVVMTLQVQENSQQTLSYSIDGKPEEVGVGEQMWKTLKDGRIIVQNFIRSAKERTGNNGMKVKMLVNNNTCIYTPEASTEKESVSNEPGSSEDSEAPEQP